MRQDRLHLTGDLAVLRNVHAIAPDQHRSAHRLLGAAGLFVGVSVMVVAISGLARRLDGIVPRPVVRGVQMVVACRLMLTGLRLGLLDGATHALRPLWGADGLMVVIGLLILTALLRRRLAWLGFILVFFGFIGAALAEPALLGSWRVSFWAPRLVVFDRAALEGVWLGGLPQLPLTVLNSVLAVSLLAGQIFPRNSDRTTPKKIAVSVGLMNLIACPLGGMPLCHGSGGLAAQHRFGARSGLSMVMLGAAKITAGLFLGGAALAWMRAFPTLVLGVFLLVAGIGFCRTSRCWVTPRDMLTASVMVCVNLAGGTLVRSFAAGVTIYLLWSVVRAAGPSASGLLTRSAWAKGD